MNYTVTAASAGYFIQRDSDDRLSLVCDQTSYLVECQESIPGILQIADDTVQLPDIDIIPAQGCFIIERKQFGYNAFLNHAVIARQRNANRLYPDRIAVTCGNDTAFGKYFCIASLN
mgnify:CR=1 FL=1